MQNLASVVCLLRVFDGDKIEKHIIKDLFCEEDLKIISSMYAEGKIEDVLDNESGKEVIALTKTGSFTLFIEDSPNDICDFGKLLDDIGVDSSHLYNYLNDCYMTTKYEEIFNINRYEIYLQNIIKHNNAVKTRELLLSNRNIG